MDDERSHILAQIDALIDELNMASKAIESEHIDERLRSSVQVRFGTLIRINREDLTSIRESVLSGQPPLECWEGLSNARNECWHVFRECLDFLEGSLMRSAGIDDGICQISDTLLNDLEDLTDMHWARLTILGVDGYFDRTAEIMRIRFPQFSIWNLPLIAHQFGHLVEFELKGIRQRRDQFPIKELIESKGMMDHKMERHSRELFCDLFGVYSMGPAFAFASLLLNFDPLKAYDEGENHPSFAKRAYFLLRALKMMNDASTGDPYLSFIERLEDIWNRSLKSIRENGLSQEHIAELDIWLVELYVLLDRYLLEVKYPTRGKSGWIIAKNWAAEWDQELKNGEELSMREYMKFATPRDMLNAAWLIRFRHPNKVSEISAQMLRQLREMGKFAKVS